MTPQGVHWVAGRGFHHASGIVGVNLAVNRETRTPLEDLAHGVRMFSNLAAPPGRAIDVGRVLMSTSSPTQAQTQGEHTTSASGGVLERLRALRASARARLVHANVSLELPPGAPAGVHYLVLNLSSPNTPGLRNLQQRANLEALLTLVRTFTYGLIFIQRFR